jgi:hypothetical protein
MVAIARVSTHDEGSSLYLSSKTIMAISFSPPLTTEYAGLPERTDMLIFPAKHGG